MLILFKRLYLLKELLKAFAFSLGRYPGLLLAGLPGAVLLFFSIRCNDALLNSIGSKADSIPSFALLGLVFLNLVEILAVSQQFTVWSRIADERFDEVPLGYLVSQSLKRFWEMALPLLPVWIVLPYLLHFLLTVYAGLFKLLSFGGTANALLFLSAFTLIIWPFLVIVSAKLVFLPTISLEMPRKNFFSGIAASWNYVTIRILKYHWSAFFILTLPFILGLMLPFALLQDSAFLFIPREHALKIQSAAVAVLWLIGPLSVSAAQRLNMILVREFEKEVRRLAEKQR
ncbi:hypothetical protein IKW72_06680 [bacterium]|nr:hypothetical protein [bacterium]